MQKGGKKRQKAFFKCFHTFNNGKLESTTQDKNSLGGEFTCAAVLGVDFIWGE